MGGIEDTYLTVFPKEKEMSYRFKYFEATKYTCRENFKHKGRKSFITVVPTREYYFLKELTLAFIVTLLNLSLVSTGKGAFVFFIFHYYSCSVFFIGISVSLVFFSAFLVLVERTIW